MEIKATGVVRDATGNLTKEYPIGDFLTKQEAVDKIKSGQFTRVVWKKKNGSPAIRNVKHKIEGLLRGGTYSCDSSKYLPVVDMDKFASGLGDKSWINISIDSIIAIVSGGMLHLVKG